MSKSNPISLETPQRVLIVDDEGIVLVALRETLLREGYQPMTHSNPLQALEALKKETFSVIITDQQMPMLTGLEFLAQAKKIQPDATRILITAVLSLDTVIDAINKGEIYRFIVKPWLREELLATLKNAVHRYELICRNQILQASTLSMNEKLRTLNKSLEQQVAVVAAQNQQLALLNKEIEEDLQRAIGLCMQTLRMYYPLLGHQARRTYEISKAMAERLNLPADQRRILEAAAWISNVGLMGVSRTLIRKWHETPDLLTSEEIAVIERHPIMGQEVVQFVPHAEEIGVVVRAHHERFDGKGFPNRLAGEEIPWLARVLAVAVACAESRTPSSLPHVIQEGAGTAFDPAAAQALLAGLPNAMISYGQREVTLADLRPGMVLAKGIYTANGLMLLPEGQQLTKANIDNLLDQRPSTLMNSSLLVAC